MRTPQCNHTSTEGNIFLPKDARNDVSVDEARADWKDHAPKLAAKDFILLLEIWVCPMNAASRVSKADAPQAITENEYAGAWQQGRSLQLQWSRCT
jgi:hypothetical protein